MSGSAVGEAKPYVTIVKVVYVLLAHTSWRRGRTTYTTGLVLI
jgi:hypothetical protein